MELVKRKIKSLKEQISLLFIICSLLFSVSACSDEPDAENFYTYKGQTMSEYLLQNPQFSQYAAIVERAGLMKLLSAYGTYTCFAPTNDAVDAYLQQRGLSDISQLTDADCDTIARTHLVNNLFSTAEMGDGVLATANMNRRYLEVSHGLDESDNAVVFLNEDAHIIYELQDDSVDNGIMQPVDRVLESSNRMIVDLMKLNPNVSLFVEALMQTGVADSLYLYKDNNWDPSPYPRWYYSSDINSESATVPEEMLYGFTIFAEPDSIYREKYGITTLQQLYEKACEIYDAVYPEDAAQPWHAFDQLTDRRNPLNRFVSYHILGCNVISKEKLTPYNVLNSNGLVDIGIETTQNNPEDWYKTLLSHTMINVQKLTVGKFLGQGTRNAHYVNRRYDTQFQYEGQQVDKVTGYKSAAMNGIYFYVNDIVAFDVKTRDEVQNRRIRMDFSTLFPEMITNGVRLNGDPTHGHDEAERYGKNYYFPQGYLKGVKVNGYLLYRRPHNHYRCFQGDEINLQGDYDVTFPIPPVPSEGEYQIRLGYAPSSTRGIGQVYFDDKPQGIPIDMTKSLNDLGVPLASNYNLLSRDEKVAERKALKNLDYYRGPMGAYMLQSGSHYFLGLHAQSVRRVVCTVHISPDEDHFLRFRNVSNNGSSELMLDFIEIVPRSVYGVTDEGEPEDDL
ncbi:MAG: fasciclin domain-containing protein [Prevotella sp.]|nr:fasciclin domain-containing protein [Prevotella sp.]